MIQVVDGKPVVSAQSFALFHAFRKTILVNSKGGLMEVVFNQEYTSHRLYQLRVYAFVIHC